MQITIKKKLLKKGYCYEVYQGKKKLAKHKSLHGVAATIRRIFHHL